MPNRVMWLLKRALGYDAPPSVNKQQLYTTFVKSSLEYCPQVWGGTTKGNIKILEGVQRRATRYILGFPELDYKERLAQLNILSLSYRREYLDLCFLCKCFNSEYNVDISQFANVMSGERETRFNNHTMRLKQVLCRTETFKRCYYNRIVHTWNMLPEAIRLCENTITFKRMVKDFYQSLFNP